MTSPSSELVDHIVVGIVLVLQLWQRWTTAKNHRISHEELRANREDIREVKADTSLIKRSVNGPLGVALAAAANALEELAKTNPTEKNILQAVAARKESDAHAKIYAESLSQQLKSEAEKQAIIEEFMKNMR